MISTDRALPLLAGLTPAQFMRRHWQKKPLLIRQAMPGLQPLLSRAELFALAAQEGVESRLVEQKPGDAWSLKQGPFERRSLPPLVRAGWTLLVQGVDQQVEAVHQLMQQFRFAPDARLDDVMISYASDGGGVGPHFDSYDVFLLQVSGRRRWRIGPQKKKQALREGVPLKILATFEPEEEWILEPGDMLYLPPRYAHDGVAVGGDCMTYSIGFRAPRSDELARELLSRLADEAPDEVGDAMYRDGTQPAVEQPAAIPAALPAFAQAALQKALSNPALLGCLLGEWLTEPKASVWFDAGEVPAALGAIRLDRRTRMMYDDDHVYINGEAFAAEGSDADLMHQLANRRELDAAGVRRCTAGARQLLLDWVSAGWVQPAR